MFLGEMFEMLNQLVFYSSNLKLSIKLLKINIQHKRTSMQQGHTLLIKASLPLFMVFLTYSLLWFENSLKTCFRSFISLRKIDSKMLNVSGFAFLCICISVLHLRSFTVLEAQLWPVNTLGICVFSSYNSERNISTTRQVATVCLLQFAPEFKAHLTTGAV